jgi:Leucine-rich repeat (LRR) protein
VLSLEDNAISDWSTIELLQRLPSLARLHLSNNPLEDVRYPGQAGQAGAGQAGQPFAQLSALLLGSCVLRSWGALDALDAFPALRELRLSGNPLLEGAKSGGRFEVGRAGCCCRAAGVLLLSCCIGAGRWAASLGAGVEAGPAGPPRCCWGRR